MRQSAAYQIKLKLSIQNAGQLSVLVLRPHNVFIVSISPQKLVIQPYPKILFTGHVLMEKEDVHGFYKAGHLLDFKRLMAKGTSQSVSRSTKNKSALQFPVKL